MTSKRTTTTQTNRTCPAVSNDFPRETAPEPRLTRRTLLAGAAGVVAASLVAGCSSSERGTHGDDGGNGGDGDPTVDEWLSDTENYDAVVNRTETGTVTVNVGARGNRGSNAFDPPAIRVAPGTKVVWKWVDGYHNVVDRAGTFESGDPEQNATFEQTFENAGTTLYYCEPHRSIGMKGAVVVDGAATGSTEGSA